MGVSEGHRQRSRYSTRAPGKDHGSFLYHQACRKRDRTRPQYLGIYHDRARWFTRTCKGFRTDLFRPQAAPCGGGRRRYKKMQLKKNMHLKSATVLVVDDEPMLCEIFGEWLESEGCRVLKAQNGSAALGVMAAER